MNPIHEEILRAALRICRARSAWVFAPIEIVRALPHLNEGSVRTHIVSRCCVNAPKHHQHRWDYFRRMGRGRYEIEPKYRRRDTISSTVARTSGVDRVAEPASTYRMERPDAAPRDAVHAVVVESEGWYVAECLEVAVVSQGRTLDETVANLHEAVRLHLGDGDAAHLGLSPTPRLIVSYESASVAS